MPAPPPRRSATERTLLVLKVLLAVGAYGGALSFFLALEAMESMRELLPFGSFLLAGLALAAVNGVPTVVVVGALRDAPWARDGHLAVGLALIAWIVVQVAVLG